MAGIAGRTHVLVAVYVVVFISQIVWVVVLMAINTAKQGIIPWRGMALGTLIPFIPVFTAEYGKVLAVMVPG